MKNYKTISFFINIHANTTVQYGFSDEDLLYMADIAHDCNLHLLDYGKMRFFEKKLIDLVECETWKNKFVWYVLKTYSKG